MCKRHSKVSPLNELIFLRVLLLRLALIPALQQRGLTLQLPERFWREGVMRLAALVRVSFSCYITMWEILGKVGQIDGSGMHQF
jgi:hypothetical protein